MSYNNWRFLTPSPLLVTKLRLSRTNRYTQHKIQNFFLKMSLIVWNSNIEHRDNTFVAKLTLESLIFTNFFQNCLVFADGGATAVATAMLWRGGGAMVAATAAVAAVRPLGKVSWSAYEVYSVFWVRPKKTMGFKIFWFTQIKDLKSAISVFNIRILNYQIHIQKKILDFVLCVQVCPW